MSDASLGSATLRTRLDTSGLRTGLEQAKTETQRAAGDIVRTLRGAFAGAVAAFASSGITQFNTFLQRSAQLAHQAEASHRLFERQLMRSNESLARGRQLVQELSDRFGVANSVIEESATLLLRAGGSLEDVERALVAAGATGAAAGIDLERAFSNMAIAVSTGRSTLLDTIGVVTNLGPAVQAYARSIGKTVEELTQAELIQARVNAIYEETASEIEDVDTILAGLPLSQARVNQEWRIFRENVGEVAQQFIIPLNRGLESTLSIINSLHPELTRFGVAFVGLSLGASGLAASFQALRTVLPFLRMALLPLLGPGGLIAAGAVLVGSLAFAFAGRPSSLDRSVEKAQQALAGNDANSLAGALDEIVRQVDGPVREVFEELRDDLRETGDVGVEQAQRIANALSLIDELRAAQERVARAQAEVEAIRAASAGEVIAGFGSPDPANVEQMLRDTLGRIGPEFLKYLRFSIEENRFFFAPREDGSPVRARDPEQAALVAEALMLANRQLAAPVSQLAAAERELAEATAELEALRARIDSAGRTAGTAGTAGATREVEVEVAVSDPAAAAKRWVERLEAELRFGLKGPREVIDLLSPRVEELREEAAFALAEFGIDSQQYRDTVAKLDVIEDFLQRVIRMDPTLQIRLDTSRVESDLQRSRQALQQRFSGEAALVFTVQAVERTEGQFESLEDAISKLSRAGVVLTAPMLELLTERFEGTAAAADRAKAAMAELRQQELQRLRDIQTQRFSGDAGLLFTLQAVERTEGQFTSVSDAMRKLASVGVVLTAPMLELLEERFKQAEAGADRLKEALIEVHQAELQRARDTLTSRFQGDNAILFTVQAVERTAGAFTSVEDAMRKLSRAGVVVTGPMLEYLIDRFGEMEAAVDRAKAALAELREAELQRLRDIQTSRFSGEAAIAFTVQAVERTAGAFTSVGDAMRKLADAGVTITGPMLEYLIERFSEMEAAADRARVAMAELRRQELQRLRDIQTLRFSGEAAIAFTVQAVERTAGAFQSVGDAIRKLADAGVVVTSPMLEYLIERFESAAQTAEEEFNARVGQLSLQLGRRRAREDQPYGGGLIEAGRILKDRAEEAGRAFMSHVLTAGQSFVSAIEAFQAGNVGGGIAALGSSIGDVISGLGSLGVAGFGPWGALVGAGASLLGGIVSLFEGDSRRREAEREQRRSVSVPAIELHFTVNQTNYYQGGPNQPEIEQAFRRQAIVLWEELYRRNLGPRFDRIEQRLGIAGAPA